MLIGIAPCISPDLLSILHRMGHGDEIVLADAFFPAESCSQRVVRADGVELIALLDGILRLINPDDFVADPLVMMAAAGKDQLDPRVAQSYRAVIDRHWPEAPAIQLIERFAFYERTRHAFAVVLTGQQAKYGNIIIKKGVVPVG